jgi:hypothetical protein
LVYNIGQPEKSNPYSFNKVDIYCYNMNMETKKTSEALSIIKLTWKPVTAGILEIVTGAIGMVGGLYLVVLTSLFKVIHEIVRLDPMIINRVEQIISNIIALPFVVVFIGIAAIIGGVYSLQRRIFGLALAGAICACVIFPVFGLPAIIITAFAKDEFN